MHTFIIAEAGVNHNGQLDMAKKLIEAAAHAGADAVKFQSFNADTLVSKTAPKAAYQQANCTIPNESQHAMLKKLELTEGMHRELLAHCQRNGIQFLSTGFDEESLTLLAAMELPYFKIPSGELTNKPYLKQVAGFGNPVILSTGMADMAEVKAALKVLLDHGITKDNVTVLHCTTQYPTPYEAVNLKAMQQLQAELGVKVGYSDHTPGIEVPIAAVALGATLIEKHLTLDRRLPGPDHQASLEPAELKAMVTAIRHIEQALSGTGVKAPTPGELANLTIARKSIVAAQPIKRGEHFNTTNLTVKRPGTGLSPMCWDDVMGRCASHDYQPDEPLSPEECSPKTPSR
jgi:N,N'-diacetyllegionaminate synthase